MQNQAKSKAELKQVYTVQEVAEILCLKVRAAYDFCKNTKEFKVVRCGERTIRVLKNSFDQWLLETDQEEEEE